MTGREPNPTTVLRLTGRDVLDLLHRISTQALIDLAVGEARATLFCDFRARLLHRAFVVRMPDESVWLLRDDAPGDSLAAHIDKHVFREDVRIEDCGSRWTVVGRLGSPLDPDRVEVRDGVPARVGIAAGVALELVAVSAATPSAADDAAWELARIEAGRPRHGHEIAEAFHPYEVGLADEVHLSKGCYTGQEVLQRLVTYDSVRRVLVRVGGSGAAPGAPAAIVTPTARAGTLTSAVSDEGGWQGLAVLLRSALEPVVVLSLENSGVLSRAIPFPASRPRGRAANEAGSR